MIDYNAASKTYDHTRSHSDRLIDLFDRKVKLSPETVVLDYGCGTGNYLNRIRERFGCSCCGVEPSEGMRAAALEKNPQWEIKAGDHRNIPFADATFDFAYMTDVIHHVPGLAAMFSQLARVMKAGGLVGIVTQSHAQIEARVYNHYFPSMAGQEKERYPDLPAIVRAAMENGFLNDGAELSHGPPIMVINEAFVRNVEEKNFSMFRRLEEPEFQAGLKQIRADLGKSYEQNFGETCLWFKR